MSEEKNTIMHAAVDQIKCRSVGICVTECPQVFHFEPGSKRASVRLDPVPRRYHAICRELVKRCPEGAISITEDQHT
jgi:ferredoxin